MRSNYRPALIVGGLGALVMGIALVLLSHYADAGDWGLIKLDEASVEYRNHAALNDTQREPLIFPESPKEHIALNLNTDLLSVFGFDSTVDAYTTAAQYRSVGLEARLYARITDGLSIGYYHHSSHVLDRSTTSLDRFPSLDAIEVKLYLFRAKPGREAMF